MTRLALIGVGLIGGSAALAFKRAEKVESVAGFDADPAACAEALARGVIDRAAGSVADAVRAADLVLLAVPVGATTAVLAEVAAAVPAHAVITDVGSTKRSVIDAAQAVLNAHSSFSFRRFVPGHPIAGGERPGVAHADADLFRGKLFVSTPVAETHADALAKVEALWRAVGANVQRMDADEHDRIFAAISHLPHLLAFALVAQIAAEPDGSRKLGFAGAGFRDFTRIAASSPVMWRDIALANRDALGAELRGYRGMLDRLQQALEAGDAAALEDVFARAAQARRAQQRGFDGE
ncbi:MAG: prephenate dehydrogenase [Betaproteobacteria bacterium]